MSESEGKNGTEATHGTYGCRNGQEYAFLSGPFPATIPRPLG